MASMPGGPPPAAPIIVDERNKELKSDPNSNASPHDDENSSSEIDLKNVITVFIGNMDERISEVLIRNILTQCGYVHSWKRIASDEANFGFCDFLGAEAACRCVRLLDGKVLGAKPLSVKLGKKNMNKVDELKQRVLRKLGKSSDLTDNFECKDFTEDTEIEERDNDVWQNIDHIIRSHRGELGRDIAVRTPSTKIVKDETSHSNNHVSNDKPYNEEINRFRDSANKKDTSSQKDDDNDDGESVISDDALVPLRNRRTLSRSPEPTEKRVRRKSERSPARQARSSRRSRSHSQGSRSRSKRRSKSQRDTRSQSAQSDKAAAPAQEPTYDLEAIERGFGKRKQLRQRRLEASCDKLNKELEAWLEREKSKRKKVADKLRKAEEKVKDTEIWKRVMRAKHEDYVDLRDDPRYFSLDKLNKLEEEREKEKILDEEDRKNDQAFMDELRQESLRFEQSHLRLQRSQEILRREGNAAAAASAALEAGSELLASDSYPGTLQGTTDKVPKFDTERDFAEYFIRHIPTQADAVFAWNVERQFIDSLMVEKKIRPWVDKKMETYFGAIEADISEFICKSVIEGSSAFEVKDVCQQFLEDEAQSFTVNLWRKLIYETEARKQGFGVATLTRLTDTD